MRRGVWLLVLGVFATAFAAASARADGTPTTTTGTTTTTTTGTTTTTTTTTPAYARLSPSYLPAGCVGAGAAAIAVPGRPILTVGTPASNLGPSAYPANAGVVAFGSSTGSGTTCSTGTVTLQSVSLLGGEVTAASVEATHAKGTVAGLAIGGTATTLGPGETLAIGNWARLTLGKRVGRLAAPLVLRLLASHGSLPAGTVIAVAFAAAPQPVAKPTASPQTSPARSQPQAKSAKPKPKRRQPAKPPPDFPTAPSPLTKDGDFTDAVRDNPVISIAMQYLGVRYQWGGASPATGFDCSGLVQYVFAQLGVPLVHYAAAQWHSPGGVWVPPDRLRPGELVFFTGSDGTRKEPGHVGIYVEDGYFIDAPHTGSFVRVDSLSEPKFANQYVGARKIVGQEFLARHLLHAKRPDAPTTGFPLGFPAPISFSPLGASLGVAAAGAATTRPAPHGYWIWAGALGVLLLSIVAGALVVRHRHASSDPVPSGESSN